MDDVELKPLWTQEEAIAFECAREAINHVMAICSAQIAAEERKLKPDNTILANLNLRQDRLHQERVALRLKDHTEVARVRAEYGAEVRAWNKSQGALAAE